MKSEIRAVVVLRSTIGIESRMATTATPPLLRTEGPPAQELCCKLNDNGQRDAGKSLCATVFAQPCQVVETSGRQCHQGQVAIGAREGDAHWYFLSVALQYAALRPKAFSCPRSCIEPWPQFPATMLKKVPVIRIRSELSQLSVSSICG